MSEEKAVVNYEEILAGLAKKQAATAKPPVSTIGTRSGVLTYNGDMVPGNKLSCIIIASTHANKLYDGPYDPNNLKNPDCYAYSEDGKNMKPHPSVVKPIHDNCDECPYNQWGSAEQGKGKKCKNVQHIGLIPSDTAPEDVETAELALLSLPVTSGKNFDKYVNKLTTLFGRPTLAMVTEIGTRPDAKTQFQVTFDDKGPVDPALIPGLVNRFEKVLPILEREYEPNVEQSEEDKAKAQKRGAKF